MNDFAYSPNGQPFFLRGGPTGCLLIHGFTGVPGEMRWLGEYLGARGHTVLGVRLTGHGTAPDDLAKATWQHWLGCAADGWQILRDQCERVFVMGLSLGGLTAINLAARFPLDGLVGMSTPIRIEGDWRLNFVDAFAVVLPYLKKRLVSPEQEAFVAPGHYSYPVWPVKAIKQLMYYAQITEEILPRVTAPSLLIHSKQDADVSPENLTRIYERIGSSDKKMFWLERSGHVVTEGPERQLLFEHVGAFIKSHGG